jgi:hypothetical protein
MLLQTWWRERTKSGGVWFGEGFWEENTRKMVKMGTDFKKLCFCRGGMECAMMDDKRQ